MDGYQAYAQRVNPAVARFLELTGRDLRIVRGEGAALVTADGQRYDDWVAGFGAANLGHNPPALLEAARAQLESGAPNLLVENLNPSAGALAEALCAAAGGRFAAGGTAFFCNSGAEAVEATIKIALAATGRPKVAYASGGYHGATLGALACMARGLYRDPFERALPAFVEVPFGDGAALERALAAGDVAGFLVEPVQAEAGMRFAAAGYLSAAREACRRAGALLIFDEVQTGMGRTGTLFAFQGLGVEPDLLALAKSLGGGLVPIGCALAADGLWSRAFGGFERAEIHGSTLGGNALACAVAARTLRLLSDEKLLAGVRARGERLFAELSRALGGSKLVARVEGRGLLGGVEVAPVDHPWLDWKNLGVPELDGRPVGAALLALRLFKRRIFATVCGHHWGVLRVEPPLTVDDAACARFVDAVAEAVAWLEEAAA
jgi:putrescine aminotransferase